MLNATNSTKNGRQAVDGDVQMLACTLYVLWFACADAYSSVVNAHNAQEAASGS